MSTLNKLLVMTAIGCAWFTTAQALPATAVGHAMPSLEAQTAQL